MLKVGGVGGGDGKGGQKIKTSSSRDLMYSVTIVNNTVLYVGKLLRDLKSSHYEKKKITTIWDDWC